MPRAFRWNGDNYFLKMLHDCDFLDRVEPVRHWFGFSLSRNPLFFYSSSSRKHLPSIESEIGDTIESFTFDQAGLAGVGQQPWLGPLVVPTGHSQEHTRNDKRKRRKKRSTQRGANISNLGSLAPYSAAVVNDPSLLPVPPSPSRHGLACAATAGEKSRSATESTTLVDTGRLVPNLMSREDMIRVVAANRVLVEEEVRASGAAVFRPGKGVTRAANKDGRGNSIEGQREPRPSLCVEGKLRGKRPSQSGTQDAHARDGKRLISAWSSDPDAVHEMRSTSGRVEDVPLLARTTGRLLQRSPPDPHPSLGPVLLRSHLLGGEMHPKPFIRTVSGSTIEYMLTHAAHSQMPVAAGIGMADETRTPLVAKASPEGCWVEPVQLSGTPSDAPLCSSPTIPFPSLPALADNLPLTETQRANKATGLNYGRKSEGDNGRQYANRALQKAGAELRALTAAGTTGRRIPPPREARLRRLARDVARHSAELRELTRAEKRLHRYFERVGLPDAAEDTLAGVSTNGMETVEPLNVTAVDQPLNDKESPAEPLTDVTTGASNVLKNNCMIWVSTSTKAIDASCMAPNKGWETGATSETGDPIDRITVCGKAHVSQQEIVETKKRLRGMLEVKRREIDLKTFDLAVKRQELDCLREVQKQEQQRKQAMKLERLRARLKHGQVI